MKGRGEHDVGREDRKEGQNPKHSDIIAPGGAAPFILRKKLKKS